VIRLQQACPLVDRCQLVVYGVSQLVCDCMLMDAQVRGVQRLLGWVMRGLTQRLWYQDLSAGQGCALVQAMDCLVSLVKQQSRSKQKPDADLLCFR